MSFLGFSSLGFAGSRRPHSLAPLQASGLARSAAAAGCHVLTTCGAGVPAAVAAAAPAALVYRRQFPGKGGFVARAVRFVEQLAASPAPALLVWPAGPAPAASRPATRWVSCGSGSWSEAGLAAGLAVPVFVALSGSQPPAPHWPGSWQPVTTGPLAAFSFQFTFWQFVPARRPARQPSLF